MAGSNRRFTLAAILLPLLFLTMSGLARAATLTVTSNADPGPGTLRAEIAAAASGDTIDFLPGLSGQTITLVSLGLDINKNLTITGPSGGITISGKILALLFFPVMSIGSPAMNVSLNNLTIADGGSDAGAGIFVEDTSLNISNCTFSNNSAISPGSGSPGSGGAISNHSGSVTINNSTFSSNTAAGPGGAIANHGGPLTITNSTFANNSATGSFGAGGAIEDFNAKMLVTNRRLG